MIQKYLLLFFFISTVFAGANDACTEEGSQSNSDEWWFVPELSWFETAVGVIIVLFTFIAVSPQIYKLIKRRSSEGLSAEYIFFLAINQIFAFTNSTIFNYPYMQSCPHVGYDICIPALLTWCQVLVSITMYFIMFTLLFIFFEKKSGTRWKVVIGYYIFYLLFLAFSAVMIPVAIAVIGNCSDFSQGYARAFGICAMVVTFIQYVPQLYTTFKMKTSGTLSLFANIIQVGGFVVMICFMLFSKDQDITSLLGFMVSLVLQSVLLLMQLYFDYLPKWCGKKKKTEDEEAKLISSQQTENENEIKEEKVEETK